MPAAVAQPQAVAAAQPQVALAEPIPEYQVGPAQQMPIRHLAPPTLAPPLPHEVPARPGPDPEDARIEEINKNRERALQRPSGRG